MKTAALLIGIFLTFTVQARLFADTTIKGVQVSFAYTKNIFPEFWQNPPINAFAEPVEQNEIDRCKAIIIRAPEKYPSFLLSQELKNIYFIRAMKFYDVGYGGTNSTDALYLANS